METSRKMRDNDRRMGSKVQTHSVSFRIEEETNEKLEDLCIRKGVSKSSLVKRLIRQYVAENYD